MSFTKNNRAQKLTILLIVTNSRITQESFINIISSQLTEMSFITNKTVIINQILKQIIPQIYGHDEASKLEVIIKKYMNL